MLKKANLGDRIKKLFGLGIKEDELFEDIEEALIEGDIGPIIAMDVIDELKLQVKKNRLKEKEEYIEALKQILGKYLKIDKLQPQKKVLNFFLILGVNGVGKTTTVAKLAEYYRNTYGISKILLSAADTFRAAAIDQLKIHGDRLDLKVISHVSGADPGAVIFDTITSALSKDIELVIADTAGRLHNKENLVKELVKIDKIVTSRIPPAQYKKILVIDATTGQNAYKQAETFKGAVNIDSIILTKYDSTAKGGVVISICKNLGIPFSFMGTGEKIQDFMIFDKDTFLDTLFGNE
jgi:fused signal recognition particle receptor